MRLWRRPSDDCGAIGKMIVKGLESPHSDCRFDTGADHENDPPIPALPGCSIYCGEDMTLNQKTLSAPLEGSKTAFYPGCSIPGLGPSPLGIARRNATAIGLDMIYIVSGCILFVLGMNGLLIPRGFVAGGLAGVALLLSYSVPYLGVGWWYLLLNIPLMVLGRRSISPNFFWLTLFGMGVFSTVANWVKPTPFDIQDPILAAVAAGVLCGAGAGLVLKSRGSAGGLDILSVYLNRKWGFSLGSVGMAMNGLLLAVAVWIYDVNVALYSALFFFVCSRMVDTILRGINPQKVMLVISDNAEEIATTLMTKLNCGVTFLKGEGGYEKKEKKIIYSIVRQMNIPRLKTCITTVDPGAFIVINHSCEASERRTFAGIGVVH